MTRDGPTSYAGSADLKFLLREQQIQIQELQIEMLLVLVLPVLVWRLKDEKFLARNLPGYREYQRSVHYRLLPSIW